jgi:signal transduction histidine kinase
LRTQVAVAFGVTTLIALVSMAILTWAFVRQVDARSTVLNRVDPAAIAARDVYASLVDQETGVRGFALARDEQFLTPYETGRRRQAADTARLRSYVSGDRALEGQVDALGAAATLWHEDAAVRLIAAARANRTDLSNTAILERSKTQFDAVRRSYARLDRALGLERQAARDEIDTRTTQLIVIGVVLIAVLAACAVVVWVGLRRLVLAPIDRLGEDAGLVTAGDVRHEIQPSGPAELAELGAAIEAMRRNIVDELAAVEQARASLIRQTLELNRSNAELEQFAYVASHDLQEPLRKITSFCQLIEQRYADQLDERGRQYIDFAVDGAKRMQQLILDLLTFSRVGRTTTGFVAVDLARAARTAADDLQETIRERHAIVEIGDLPTVKGDTALLTALFQNLISNAIKFNRAAVPTVTISSRPIGRTWELTCADNGIGIEPQHAERVFMIFQRLHGRDAYEGTGIGLALAQKIVTYHGGTIWIDPDVTTGTTIRWTLPTTPPGAPTA